MADHNIAWRASADNETNQILGSLPAAEFERVRPHLSERALTQHVVLYESGQQIDEVCFVDAGMVSIVTVLTRGGAVETAVIGREGMSGVALLHFMRTAPERAIVQVPGWARFMPVAAFPELMQSCPTLRFKLHRFAFALYALAARTSACNRRHRTDQRLARWLLLTQDRSDSTTLPLTHQFIALMLGVRRSTVTNTAEQLRTAGLIKYSRGRIQIVDRDGLERRSCDCYQVVQDVYTAALSAVDESMIPMRQVS